MDLFSIKREKKPQTPQSSLPSNPSYIYIENKKIPKASASFLVSTVHIKREIPLI